MIDQTGLQFGRAKAVNATNPENLASAKSGGEGAREAFLSLFNELVGGSRASSLAAFPIATPIELNRIEQLPEETEVAPIAAAPVVEEAAPKAATESQPKAEVVDEQAADDAAANKSSEENAQAKLADTNAATADTAAVALAAEQVAANQVAPVVQEAPKPVVDATPTLVSQDDSKPVAQVASELKSTQVKPEEMKGAKTKEVAPEASQNAPIAEAQEGAEQNAAKQNLSSDQGKSSAEAQNGARREVRVQQVAEIRSEGFDVKPVAKPLTPSAVAPMISAAEIAKGAAAVSAEQVSRGRDVVSAVQLSARNIQAVGAERSVKEVPFSGSTNLTAEKKANVSKDVHGNGKGAGVNQAKIVEQIQKLMDSAIQSKDGNTIVLRLDPEELGAIMVKVTKRADQIFARVSSETPDVDNVLRNHVQEIVQSLAAAGFRPENVHVSIGSERSDADLAMFQQFSQQRTGAEGERAGSQSNYSGGSEKEAAEPAKNSRKEANLDSGWVA